MRIYFFLAFSFLTLISCTKEVKYSKEALLAKAKDADPTVSLILPKTMADGVSCSDYTSSCLSAHTVQVKGLELIAVEFISQEEAIHAAKKFRGFYSYNWMFDDVVGEPVLEQFVVEELEAKKP